MATSLYRQNAWAEAQEGRYEFDGIQPVAMTRGNLGHGRILRNINRQLANRLAGRRCESMGPEAGVATVGQTVRYPDAVVTCSGARDQDGVPFAAGKLADRDMIRLPEIGIEIPVAAIYEGTDFGPNSAKNPIP